MRTVPTGWSGRIDAEDGPAGARWHQEVSQYRLGAQPGVALLGFVCDEGVRRNLGRVGAAEGPGALRGCLSNLPVVGGVALYDAGDVTCVGGALERAQALYADRAEAILRDGSLLIGLGGGHEIAWASISGLLASDVVPTGGTVGILNIDAHFDLRRAKTPNSGTSFRQALERKAADEVAIEYWVLGISEAANTLALFQAAQDFGVMWRTDEQLNPDQLSERLEELAGWFPTLDALYLTICLDVLPAAAAPGVSAPAARGVGMESVETIVAAAAASGKLRIADVAELCPRLDVDSRTARTAARLIWRIVRDHLR